jgi:hypothetical protein
MGTGRFFPQEVNWLKHEADHSPPTSAEVRNMWIYTLTPPYAFMASFKYRDNFILVLLHILLI